MSKKIILAVILLASLLRLVRLGSYPALNADEAAIGYNAYSLLQTGMDEHGNPWPVHFQSFNDYKPGLYVYMVMPFVQALGLNPLAVRLPAAIVSVATVYLTYLLVLELFGNKQRSWASIAGFLMAISPWHIHFSRGGWEVTVATFFITLGFYLFAKAGTKPRFYTLSLVSFVLSLYTYHAARVIVPVVGMGLFITYFNRIKRQLRAFGAAVLIAGIVAIPLLSDLTTGGVLARASGVGLFADTGPSIRAMELYGEHGSEVRYFKVLHNRYVTYTLTFLGNYFKHFNGTFLFITGDGIERNKVPEMGQLYLVESVFLAAGAYLLIQSKRQKSWRPLLVWLFVAPVPASLTFQSPHALRAQGMVIPLTIISAYGLSFLLKSVKKKISDRKFRIACYSILAIVMIWSLVRYQLMYWLHMPRQFPYSTQYGVEELVDYLVSEAADYESVVITTRYDQPYILALFYTKYPPAEFQGMHELTAPERLGFSTVESYDRYRFKVINFDTDKLEYPGALIIGTDREIPDEANIIKEIRGENGFLYFQVVQN